MNIFTVSGRTCDLNEEIKQLSHTSGEELVLASSSFDTLWAPSLEIVREAGLRALGAKEIFCPNLQILHKNALAASELRQFEAPKLKVVGEGALAWNTALERVGLSEAPTTRIFDRGFEGCTGLTYLKLPETLISIGAFAFCGCNMLLGLVLPRSIREIGSGAFHGTNGALLLVHRGSYAAAWCETWSKDQGFTFTYID